MKHALTFPLLLALLASCSASQSPSGGGAGSGTASGSGGASNASATAAPDASASPSASADGGASLPWAQMNHDQRREFMAHTVMPEMRALFQGHDAQRFANFTCATCHGANAREVNFHMPNGIAPLDPSQIGAMFRSQDPMHVFMTQRVHPRMVAMLGTQPYNPQTHQGFGCLGCHGTRTAAAAPAAH